MSDAVMVPRALVTFLLGETDLDGYWFGDTKPGPGVRRAAFWWREDIRKALAASTPVGGWEEPVAWRYRNVAGGWTLSDRPLPGTPASEPLYAAPPPPSVSTDNGSRPQEAVPTEGHGAAVVSGHAPIEIDHPYLPEEMRRQRIDLARRVEEWGLGTVVDTLITYALAQPSQGSFAGSLWAIAEQVKGLIPTPQPADGCSSNEGAGE